MARGWDSKAIEDQIADAEAAKAVREKAHVDPAEREAIALRASIELSRTLILNRVTRDERYRAQLQAALDHLDAQLRALDPGPDSTSNES